MQLVKPLPFQEAVDKLGSRTLIGSKLSSSEWADVPVALRERAFFSARVESARVLQRGRDLINDFLQSSREAVGDRRTDGQNLDSALKVGSRADFVKIMQDFLAGEGIDRTTGSLTDLAGERRLGLIFNTQTRQANDYGTWKQGQDVDLLNEFPAQRFIRVEDVEEPRTSHTEFEGQVYLKTDPIWVTINDDFGVPWGPWGWGCGHDVEDVDRTEAEQLGLLQPGQELQPIERDFNEGLQASTRGLDPDLLEKLKADFGEKIVVEGDTMMWKSETRQQPRPTGGASVPASQPELAKDEIKFTGEVVRETEKAILLRREGFADAWLPRSQIKINGNEITAKDWLAKKFEPTNSTIEARIERQTDKAIAVRVDVSRLDGEPADTLVWLPRSQIKITEAGIEIPNWLKAAKEQDFLANGRSAAASQSNPLLW